MTSALPDTPPRTATHTRVGHEPIDLGNLTGLAIDPACGAVASFLGTVRSPNRGERVEYIDYEGYEAMIVRQMERVAADLRERYALGNLVIAHRLGRLHPGEISLAVIATGRHRQEALAACRDGVDLCKERLPVWKFEVTESGGDWVEGRADAGPTL